MAANGELTIAKAGTVSLNANFDVVGPGNYTEIELTLNNVDIMDTLAPNNGTNWSQVSLTAHLKVVAGDVLAFWARPSQIAQMDNGSWSTLSVQWTGVP